MLFSSSVFIFLFLPIVILVYYVLLRKTKARNIFLLISSLVFYAWGEPKFVFIMILSIMVNYFFGLLVDKHRKNKIKSNIIITLMVIYNVSVILIFKYLMFILTNINSIFGLVLKIPEISLPIGISFFTFQSISYVIDVYKENGKVQKNPLNVGLYISFFPQLIAGPIVRYETVSEQINSRHETFEDFSKGICRFIVGLAKKVLLANTFAVFADSAFNSNPSTISLCMAWLGILSYTFQIYFDFSGYSDMAIGLGKMFGFNFNENFNYPYISTSVSEFWRRWHISLGTWFRDYVYIPLGGSRVNKKTRLMFNILIVWLLTGIWHGANWTFIVWGLYYFLLLTIEKISYFENKFKNIEFLKWIYTFLCIMVGWVIFRSDNIMNAINYLKSMLCLNGNSLTDIYIPSLFEGALVYFISAAIISTPISKYLSSFINKKRLDNTFVYNCLYVIIVLSLYLVSLGFIIKGTYNPFIYFNF